MNDLAAKRLKILNRVRELLWKYEQHRKHPSNPWTEKDAEELHELLALVEILVPPEEFEKGSAPQDFEPAMLSKEDLQKLKKDIEKFTDKITNWIKKNGNSNLPPKDLIEASEKAMARAREENPTTPEKTKLVSWLSSRFRLPASDAQDLVTTMSTPPIAYDSVGTLSAATGVVLDPLTTAAAVTVLDATFRQTTPEYSALTEYFSTATQLLTTHPIVTSTTIASLSQPALTISVTPSFESALTETLTPAQVHTVITWLSEHLSQLNSAIASAQNKLSTSSLLTASLEKDLSLGFSKDPQVVYQAGFVLKQAYPMLLSFHQQAEKIITNPEKVKEFERFLKRLAISYAQSRGQVIPPEVIKAIEDSPLTSYFQISQKIDSVSQPEELVLTEDLAHPETEEPEPETRTSTTLSSSQRESRLKQATDTVEFIQKTADVIEKVQTLLGTRLIEGVTVANLAADLGIGVGLASVLFLSLTGAAVGTSGLAEKFGLLDKWATFLNQNQLSSAFAQGLEKTFSTLPHWISRLPYSFQPFWKAFGLLGRSFAHFIDWINSSFFRFVKILPHVSVSQVIGKLGVRANISLSSVGTAAIGTLSSFVAIVAVVFLSIPIIIALILFIINTSALVVPPHKGAFNPSTSTPDFVIAGSCPVTENPYISRGSLGGLGDRAHGDATYGPHCYGIPIEGLWLWYDKPANDPSFLACPKSTYSCNSSVCPYYGFAADVKSSTNPYAIIILPKICSKESSSTECGDMTWRVTDYLYNCNGGSTSSREECTREQGGADRTYWGWGVVFESDSNGHHWKLYLNHIDPKSSPGIGQTFKSGQVFATITRDYPDHTHIELIVDGVPARPDYLCAK